MTQKRRETPGYVGVESLQHFFNRYKNYEGEKAMDDESTHEKSATTAYLREVAKMNLIPSPKALI